MNDNPIGFGDLEHEEFSLEEIQSKTISARLVRGTANGETVKIDRTNPLKQIVRKGSLYRLEMLTDPEGFSAAVYVAGSSPFP